jgi:hypothetical protein
VLGHDVSASVAMEKLVAPLLSQQPLVSGPLVQATATEVFVDATEEVVDVVACLLANLRGWASGSTEAEEMLRNKLMERTKHQTIMTRLN